MPGPSPYHRLNPLTKLVLATAISADAVLIGGVAGPLLLALFAVLVPAMIARVLGSLLRTTAVLSLPLAVSVLVVNLLFYPGGSDVIARLGPLTATVEGLTFAVDILARLAAISSALTLFYLTTSPGDLTLDLERRGVPQRLAFVANASVQTVPAIVERAAMITAAQRARGLDTEGSVWARVRGIVPIVGPVLLGSISDVEERAMALEARAFGRPGARTLLWAPADSTQERFVRWLAALSVAAIAVLRIAGPH